MRLWRRLRPLLPSYRAAQEREMKEELESLRAMADPKELGNLTRAAEDARSAWTIVWLEQSFQDMSYALRGLVAAPGFTLVALLSLALGIGATTAIFSLVYGVLLSPYPYANPHQIWIPEILSGSRSLTVQQFFDLQSIPAFSSAMATSMATSTEYALVADDPSLASVAADLVSPNTFEFLGVEPEVGRTFLSSDVDKSGRADAVVVLSYRLWQRVFHGDRTVVGNVLVLNDVPHRIVGVMPHGFGWQRRNAGVWRPLGFVPNDQRAVDVAVRLVAGTNPKVAEQQLRARHLQWAASNPSAVTGEPRSSLRSFMDLDDFEGRILTTSLILLFGAVTLLLLISCANVANLQLARQAARSHQIAIRMAIGAGRSRVIRQVLLESLVLALAGGSAGIALAATLIRIAVVLMPVSPGVSEARITLNVYVLAFSFVVSVMSGIFFGLVPALQCSRANLLTGLHGAARGLVEFVVNRTRGALVIAEVTLAVLLLMTSILTTRTFLSLNKVELGFEPGNVLMFGTELRAEHYPTEASRTLFYRDVLERVTALPGVEAAMVGYQGLPFGGRSAKYFLNGRQLQGPRSGMGVLFISAQHSTTLKVPLRRGRLVTENEINHGIPVAVINEAAARVWPQGQDPIGSRVQLELISGTKTIPSLTIVGILADTKNTTIRDPTTPVVFVGYPLGPISGARLAVRTRGNPMAMAKAVRQELLRRDANVPISTPGTLQDAIDREMEQPRFNMALFGLFALMALCLATAGMYSVISYHVVKRTHEVGIRMALGARSPDVLSLIMRMGVHLIGIGVAIGLVMSFAAYLGARYEVLEFASFDLLTVGAVLLVTIVTGLLACYLPARRAARLDPLVALRHE